jgi:hypothetical protein
MMKTVLEVFYVRIMDGRIQYQRKQANLSSKGGDPDQRIQSLIQEKHPASPDKVSNQEFIVHSTSWRYEQPGKVVLTYIAYSDELEFEKGKSQSFPLQKLKTITEKTSKPRTRVGLEKKIVSHGIRHIAFLIQTEHQIDYKGILTRETINVFKKVWVSLAGKVL